MKKTLVVLNSKKKKKNSIQLKNSWKNNYTCSEIKIQEDFNIEMDGTSFRLALKLSKSDMFFS